MFSRVVDGMTGAKGRWTMVGRDNDGLDLYKDWVSIQHASIGFFKTLVFQVRLSFSYLPWLKRDPRTFLL